MGADDPSTPHQRPYLKVQPTETTPAPTAAAQQFTRLHGLTATQEADADTLYEAFFETETFREALGLAREVPLELEVLLVAPAGAQPRLDYYLGCTPTDQLDRVERICRELLPADYQLTRTELALPNALGAAADPDSDPTPASAVQWYGRGERRADWQLPLTPYADFVDADTPESGATTPPLASIAATLAAAPQPAVYQALVTPQPPYTGNADERRLALRNGTDTPLGKLLEAAFGPQARDAEPDERPSRDRHRTGHGGRTRRADTRRDRQDTASQPSQPMAVTERRAGLDERDARHPFRVTARAVVCETPAAAPPTAAGGQSTGAPRPPDAVTRELADAFDHAGGRFHTIDGEAVSAADAWAALCDRAHAARRYDRLYTKLPGTVNRSPGLVADPQELPLFTLVGGATLPEAAQQALAPTPTERTPVTPPASAQLDAYTGTGLTIGRPLDGNREAGQALALPPELQALHTLLVGATGAGKTALLARAWLDNTAATDGADVLTLPKGDTTAVDLLRAYYARHGNLDGVYYFDCQDVLPALAFFDLRRDLAAGVDRTTAVQELISHYVEILKGLNGREQYEDARYAPNVIEYLVEALFDPIHGADAVGHRRLMAAADRLAAEGTPPAVSEPRLQRLFESVVTTRDDLFQGAMAGVKSRLAEVPKDRRLARMFNHVPDQPEDTDADQPAPRLDFEQLLDEDATVIIDTGGLRDEAQRAVTLVVLAELWRACRRRTRRREPDDLPLVNCYIEEAASVADTNLLDELLAQSRSFGLAVTLVMQFPGQLAERAPSAYREVLNDVGTIIAGPVGHDRHLAERLATAEMDADAVAARLRGLERGEWLVSLPARFGQPAPQPFLVRSPAPPAGHPASDASLSAAQETAFAATRRACRNRTAHRAGLELAAPQPAATAAADDAADQERVPADRDRVDTTLPYTTRFPEHLTYETEPLRIRCTSCDALYDPDSDGLRRALDCHPAGTVDPADVPIVECTLKRAPAERRATGYTDAQLMFLQAVYNAQQGKYDPPAYDLVHDSMLRLQEYVGIDAAAVDTLVDDGLLRHDGDHPHRLYTVTSDGRELLGEQHRRGVAFGHGTGDLGESSQHTLGVEAGRRWLEQAYAAAPDSRVVEVVPYYEPTPEAAGNTERLDLVGLNADGDVVVAVEVERINNDAAAAVPADYDKLAACDPDEAIWLTMTQSAGHRVLAALNDPADGDPRVTTEYASSTPVQQFRLDAPGCTGIYPISWVRTQLGDAA